MFPKAAYMTEIESWRVLPGDRIELPCAGCRARIEQFGALRGLGRTASLHSRRRWT